MSTNDNVLHFTASLSDLDRDLFVPASSSEFEYHEALRSLTLQGIRQLGGKATVSVDAQRVSVDWSRDTTVSDDPVDQIARMLTAGNYLEGILLLELLLSRDPNDSAVLFNLGMALSDRGLLDRSIQLLSQLTGNQPDSANAFVALGVALSRAHRNEDAKLILTRAVALEPENSYARRNLGAVLGRLGHLTEARDEFLKATDISPADQSAWLGLAQAEEALGNLGPADKAFLRAIRSGEHTQLADVARTARSRIAQQNFRAAMPGDLRMDAVMYCLGALESFASMSRADVQTVTFEIAALGMRGLDINSADQKYTLRSRPGKFSGLHLLCIEYVGFQQLDPSLDVGFDLSKEYAAAKGLFDVAKQS